MLLNSKINFVSRKGNIYHYKYVKLGSTLKLISTHQGYKKNHKVKLLPGQLTVHVFDVK